MADSVRIVRFTAGGQIEELLHVQSSLDYSITSMGFVRDTLAFERGERNQRMVKSGSRYGGERYAGESLANGTYKFQILTSGPTPDALLDRISRLIGELERVPGQHYIEHKADGATYPSYYEVRAPAQFQPNYNWAQAQGAGSMVTDVSWPVAPLACGAPMDVTDNFATDTLSEYTFDAGIPADTAINTATGILYPLDNMTEERRLIHIDRGYLYGDQEVTIAGTVGTTLSGFKAGVILKRTAPDTYLEAYIDDNGTASRIRIDEVIDGTRTNKSSSDLSTRLTTGQAFQVRGWIRLFSPSSGTPIEVYALYRDESSGDFTPIGANGDDSTYYEPSAAGLAAFGGGVLGASGLSWVPQESSATVTDLWVRPFSYRNIGSPIYSVTIADGRIPGDGPALVSPTFGIKGESGGSPFGMFAWSEDRSGFPSGIEFTEAEDATLTGWSVDGTEGSASGSSYARVSDASSASTYSLTKTLNVAELPDDIDAPGFCTLEIWARARLAPTLVSPRLIVSVRKSLDDWSPEIFTAEYGNSGKVLPVPLSGISWRLVRLGTIRVPRTEIGLGGSGADDQILKIEGPVGAGSSGLWGLDYFYTVPAQRRALSPTGKPYDERYPMMVRDDSEVRRTFKPNLSGVVSESWAHGGVADTGLGGEQIEVAPCDDLLILTKLGTQVPDDPRDYVGTDSHGYNYSISLGVIPRWHYQRPN